MTDPDLTDWYDSLTDHVVRVDCRSNDTAQRIADVIQEHLDGNITAGGTLAFPEFFAERAAVAVLAALEASK